MLPAMNSTGDQVLLYLLNDIIIYIEECFICIYISSMCLLKSLQSASDVGVGFALSD